MSSYLPPAIPALIETLFDQILAKAGEIRDPYEQAFFAMVHLPYLQPFIDGNKRVSRSSSAISSRSPKSSAPAAPIEKPSPDCAAGRKTR